MRSQQILANGFSWFIIQWHSFTFHKSGILSYTAVNTSKLTQKWSIQINHGAEFTALRVSPTKVQMLREIWRKTACTLGSNRQWKIQVSLSDRFWVHMVFCIKNYAAARLQTRDGILFQEKWMLFTTLETHIHYVHMLRTELHSVSRKVNTVHTFGDTYRLCTNICPQKCILFQEKWTLFPTLETRIHYMHTFVHRIAFCFKKSEHCSQLWRHLYIMHTHICA
jgi:hypothetical protein